MIEQLTIQYQIHASLDGLSTKEQELIRLAYAISDQAYAPYSKFKVGATFLMNNGETFSGNNQENIAYPSGLCAERVALFYIGANFPDEKIKQLVIVAQGDLLPIGKILSPCGGCRQVLLEYETKQNQDIEILLVGNEGRIIRLQSVKDLVPFAFGAE
jgi:cytidine deaminase